MCAHGYRSYPPGPPGARSVRSVPENTIVSFDLALEHGCDGVEFDLRLTGCGRALVCHNAKVGKITVSRATRRQLLHLPRFEDVLRHYGHRIFLDIELKVKGMESKVLCRIARTSAQWELCDFLVPP